MGERDAEHMQDYLARMNRQLSEMQNHFQSVAPRREGLARATERYLQRKTGVVHPASSDGAETAAPTSLSAQSSMCRRQSTEDACPGPSIHPQPCDTANEQLPAQAKYLPGSGLHPDSDPAVTQLPAIIPSNLDSPFTEMLHSGPMHNPAPQTPPRSDSNQSSWEPQSERGPSLQHQACPSRIALFHSPQRQRGQLSRTVSESGSSKDARSKHGSSSLAAAFEAAAACAEEVEGSRVCILSRNASEAGGRAGSRLPSFKWQQPSPSTTPEKAGRKAGKQKPPRSRAVSQGGYPQQQQQHPRSAAKLAASASSSKLPALQGNSSSSSPCSSRSMRRFASTGGVYSSGRMPDTESPSQDSSCNTFEAAATAAVAAVKISSSTLDDPQSDHELLAVINDAMEAATAAVNKPDVRIGSPVVRRMTADEAPMTRSRSDSGNLGADRLLQRHGSSLRGLAVAAAGWAKPEDRATAAAINQEDSCSQPQQQQQYAEAQHLSNMGSDSVSVADLVDGGSLCEISAYLNETEVPSERDTPFEPETGTARQETAQNSTATAPGTAGGSESDVAHLAQLEETPWPRLVSPGGAAAGAASSSSSHWRRAVSDSGYSQQQQQQQQQGTPDKQTQQLRSGARKRWVTPNKDKQQHQQEQQPGTPTRQQQSWTPTKSLKTLKTWFSEVRRSPLKSDNQRSPVQDRKHVSESGFDTAAAAAAAGGGGESQLRSAAHSRAASVGNLLGSGGLEDMPLHLLGQSGSVKTRSSVGSQLSSTPAAAAAADESGHVRRNSRSSSGSGSSVLDGQPPQHKQQQQQQQQRERLVGSLTPGTAPMRIPATSVSAECGPTTGITTDSDPAAAAALHSSAPGLLESPQERDKSSTAASSSMEAAEQDEVLFGSPAGSPASSHSHLHFTMKMARPVTASHLSMDPTAAAAAAATADEDDVDGIDWRQDSWQQQQQDDDEAGDLMLLASPTAAAAADRDPPGEVPQVESPASDSDMGSPTSAAAAAAAVGSSAAGDDDQSEPSPEPEHIMEGEPRAQETPLHRSNSSSSSFEISTDLGSSSSGSSLGASPIFGGTDVARDHAVDHSSPTSSQIQHLLQQIEESVADLDDTQPQHQPAAAAAASAAAAAASPVAAMTSFKISISPEASVVEEDSDLQQQQQQQSWHPAGAAAAAAAAAAGLAASANYERSFLGHDNAEPSGDIVVEGHSMQLPDYELEQPMLGHGPAAAAAVHDAIQSPAVQWQQHQQQRKGGSQAVRQSEIEVALPEELSQQQQSEQQQLDHISSSGSGAGVARIASTAAAAAAAAAAAKPSWGERMLDKLTSALKGSSSGRQRVKRASKAGDSPAAAAAAGAAAVAPVSVEGPHVATYRREASSAPGNMQHIAIAGVTEFSSSQLASGQSADSSAQQCRGSTQQSRGSTQQSARLLLQHESLGPQAAAADSPVKQDTDLLGAQPATLQQQQRQLQDSAMPSSTAASSSSSSSSRSEVARKLQLARAAAVAVAGVGVAAVQGTPPPHLVSCGSTLHAPTLAAVSLLLASSSCAAASSSSSEASPAVLAVSAASLAVAAAAAVAAWELDAADLAALSDSDLSVHPAAAAAGHDTSIHASLSLTGDKDDSVTNSVKNSVSNTPASARYSSGQLPPPGSININSTGPTTLSPAAAKHSALQNRIHSTPAAGANFASSPEGLSPSPHYPVAAVQSAAAAAAEVSVTSSSNMTGLPELLSDVSKAQYSRPSSALGYDARRYMEPVSPMQALSGDTAVSASAADGSSPPEVQQQQQKSEDAQMGQEMQQQQQQLERQDKQQQQQRQLIHQVDLHRQQQHRQQLSGASWSGQSSPKTADVVWMPQKASLWEPNLQQQQQQKLDHHTTQQSAVSGGGSSNSRALSAVQQLKQRQLIRRSSVGAVSNDGAEADTVAALHTSQQQQQQRVQHQLPSAGGSELCLGHGVMGELTGQQQQQQQWCSQQQQSPLQELSCTDYYRQLVQQQEALEQQRQQHSSSNSHTPHKSQQSVYTAPPAAAVVAVAPEGCTNGAATGGPRQLSALAKLRQQRQQRITQQHSFKGDGTAAAAAALRSHSAAADPGEWGSGGGAEQQQELPDQWQQHPPAVRTAWGDTTTAAQEYLPQQQQQQQQQQPNSKSTAAATSPDPAAAAAARSGINRGWSSDTGGGVAGDAGDDPAAAGSSSGSGSKPFLRRRSRTIASQKLDWSNVQSKTVHKLDDRCIPPVKSRTAANSRPSYDPALAAAQRRAGLMETASKVAAAKRGSGTNRSNKRSPNPSYESGYEVERQSSTYYRPKGNGQGGLSSVHSDGPISHSGPAAGQGLHYGYGRSRIPSVPEAGLSGAGAYSGRHAANAAAGIGLYGAPAATAAVSGGASGGARSALKSVGSFQQGSSGQGIAVQRQLSGRRSSGGGFGGSGLGPEAPLDDLLSHVNNLIKEFDRMYK